MAYRPFKSKNEIRVLGKNPASDSPGVGTGKAWRKNDAHGSLSHLSDDEVPDFLLAKNKTMSNESRREQGLSQDKGLPDFDEEWENAREETDR